MNDEITQQDGQNTDRKRIIVTGGAGFIGSHLVDRLLDQGHDVVCVDNLSTGSALNLQHLDDHPHFRFIDHDVTRPLSLEADRIYNLACPASPVHYQRDPVLTTKTAVLGAMNILELANRQQCRILQASTSEVYGDPEVHPQSEDYWGRVNPIGSRACYDEGKRCAESLFVDYHRQHGLEIKIARIFNTYGPRMLPDDGRVVSNFIVQALSGNAVSVYGDGRQTRSFCYVDDLIDGLIALMESEAAVTGPVNLGNPDEIQIGKLAETVANLAGGGTIVRTETLPPDDPKQRRPEISLAYELLGWSPKIDLETGLKSTIDYFRSVLSEDALQ